tara:strand:- start:1722 stop:2711 length:990 start_codon:yes stop_codon:yes gene_type:complete
MTRQNLHLGTYANDGTGDTLRSAGSKLNANFVELYQKLGGDSNALSGEISVAAAGITFEGTAVDDFETNLKAINPTADRIISLPDAGGSIVLDTATQTLTNKTITSPIISGIQLADASTDHKYIVVSAELVADRNVNLPLLADSDTFVFASTIQTLTNKTLTSPDIINPSISGDVNDVNGASIVKISVAGSAVNQVTIANAAAGSSPSLIATGTDTNVNLSLAGKGTGAVGIEKVAFVASEIISDGNANDAASYIICNSATPLAVSVADGTTVGEYKIFTNKGAGIATVTPVNFAQGTSFALDQYDGCQVVWDGNDWYLVGNQGEVTIA